MTANLPPIDPATQANVAEALAREALQQFGHSTAARGGTAASAERIVRNPDFRSSLARLVAAEVAALEGQLSEVEKLLKAGAAVRSHLSAEEQLEVDSRLVGAIAREIPKAAGERAPAAELRAILVELLAAGADPRKEGVNPYDLAKRNQLTSAIEVLEALGLHNLEVMPKYPWLQALELREFEAVRVDDRGEIVERQAKSVRFYREDLGGGVELVMVRVPGGTFLMGSPDRELQRRPNEGPQHEVMVPDFFIGQCVVTQDQWQAVMGSNPSKFKSGDRPVERVSWRDSQEFCQQLTARSDKPGSVYRLPSEAEWEYACRAGTQTPFYFGATVTARLANYNGLEAYGTGPSGEYRKKTTAVGQFPPNGFWLQDLHGNVWERCQDSWHDSYQDAPTNGSAWVTGNPEEGNHVIRGGSWFSLPSICRSASRDSSEPSDRGYNVGFRVVRSLPGTD